MSGNEKERVVAIGGIFFKSKDPAAMRNWYRDQLGIEPMHDWGAQFFWREHEDADQVGYTAWSLFSPDSKYMEPGTATFMINYRVRNLDRMLKQLRDAGVQVDEKIDESEFGRFGWCVDPEGNKIELWEPPSESQK